MVDADTDNWIRQGENDPGPWLQVGDWHVQFADKPEVQISDDGTTVEHGADGPPADRAPGSCPICGGPNCLDYAKSLR